MSRSHEHIANLGSLVSDAERLRSGALAAMQADPAAPADGGAVADYDATLWASVAACGTDVPVDLLDARLEPGTTTWAQLHRAAGLLEHALLVRLAESRLQAGGDAPS